MHACLALACLALGLALSLRPAEWAALIATIALVTALEMLNTVVEVVVDMISPGYHLLKRRGASGVAFPGRSSNSNRCGSWAAAGCHPV